MTDATVILLTTISTVFFLRCRRRRRGENDKLTVYGVCFFWLHGRVHCALWLPFPFALPRDLGGHDEGCTVFLIAALTA